MKGVAAETESLGESHTPQPDLRQSNLDAMDGAEFDVLIVGGGINGAVSAAALADRGLSVALAERADFAGMTSQESSNLVWGGFKYLENYELPLVWKLCRSRNQLMRSYPTNITEIGFLAALDDSSPFPPWLAALGSVGYWGIGGFATKRPSYFRSKAIERREPVINTENVAGGIEYADAYLNDNDARFVWSFVRSAIERGARAANYLSVDAITQTSSGWQAVATDIVGGRTVSLTAKAVVNAGGPLVDGVNKGMEVSTRHQIVYSKGIHLVVPKLTDSERVLAFFDDTERLFYVIPMAHRSVIGTTDTRTDEHDEKVTEEDRWFLLEQINARLDLEQPLTTEDIIAERCGVRPLVVERTDNSHDEQDWTSLSRKHEIEVDRSRKVVTIFGGKLTDCLNVGEEVVDAVKELGLRPGRGTDHWYGEPSSAERDRFLQRAATLGLDRAPAVERADSLATVLWRRHGLAANEVLNAIADDPAAGEPVLAESDILRGELELFRQREMIVLADDFFRRRTKLALIHRAEALAADPGLDEVCRAIGIESPQG
ncbi:MAG: glycerol-3-phosphate dehydrogenase/oxidase [Actinomycetota bacterium]